MTLEEKEGIFRQPLGEVLRREISTDFLKKEITLPEFLKKEIPLGILDKEIHLRRTPEPPSCESAVVEQTRCYSCGKDTPATVSTCLHCGAPLGAAYKREAYVEATMGEEMPSPVDESSDLSLIDIAEDSL